MGQSSSASADIRSTVSGSVTAMVNSTVKADADALCQNNMLVQGARNCDIDLGEQVCNAMAISNMAADQSMSTELSQNLMNQISTETSAMTEGLGIGNFSNSSTVVNNTASLSLNTAQTFLTSCTRTASAVNSMTVLDCENSTIKKGAQEADVSVVGDCVANQVGNLKAAQDLANIVDTKTTATTKGIDPFLILMLMAVGFFILMFGGPILAVVKTIGAVKGETKDETPAQTQERQRKEERQENADRMSLYSRIILGLVVLSWILVWPGLLSVALGVAPWPYVGVNQGLGGSAPLCQDGYDISRDENDQPLAGINPASFINDFMWYDPACLSMRHPSYKDKENFCTEAAKQKHYKGCGLFANTSACDAPDFLYDKGKLDKAYAACEPLLGDTFEKCEAQYISSHYFADEYEGCRRCTGQSSEEEWMADPRANFGFFVSGTGACSEGIDHRAYLGMPGMCPPDDEYCYEDIELFKAVSGSDCMDAGYQQAKKRVSAKVQACDVVEKGGGVALTALTNGGEVPYLAQQCPPEPYQYLTKCTKGERGCTYSPVACTCADAWRTDCECSAADPTVLANCHNDLSSCCTEVEGGDGELVCRDEDYKLDYLTWKKENEACRLQHENRHWLHPWGWLVPLIIQLLMLLSIGYMMMKTPLLRQSVAHNMGFGAYPAQGEHAVLLQQMKQGGYQLCELNKSAGFMRWGAVLLFFIVFMVAGWPVGMLATADASEGKTSGVLFWSEDSFDNWDSYSASQARDIGYPLFGVGLFLFVAAFIYAAYRSYKQTGCRHAANLSGVPVAQPVAQAQVVK